MNSSSERSVGARAIFRTVNEQINSLSEIFELETPTSYVCECEDTNCTRPVQKTRAEYQSIRAQPGRRVLCFDHEPPELDLPVRNQVIFREVNERIRELAEQFDLKSGAAFICECSNHTCVESIALEFEEYEAIRSSPTLFLIAPGHETLETENIVETNGRYALVEELRLIELVTESQQPITERRG